MFLPAALLVAAGGDADCTTSTVTATPQFGAYTLHAACNGSITANNVIPTGGVADVEANLLRTIPGGGTLVGHEVGQAVREEPRLGPVVGRHARTSRARSTSSAICSTRRSTESKATIPRSRSTNATSTSTS